MSKEFNFLYLVLAIISNQLFGEIAPPNSFTLRQPDGVEFEVRMFGDEYSNWIETLDGYVIIDALDEAKNIWWYYATLDKNGSFTPSEYLVEHVTPLNLPIPPKLRRFSSERKIDIDTRFENDGPISRNFIRQNHKAFTVHTVPPHPSIKPLVFLVDFPGTLPGEMPDHEYTKEQFSGIIFKEDLDPSGFTPTLPSTYTMSVRDYYGEISRGNFTILGDELSVVDWKTTQYSYDFYVDENQGTGNGPNGITHSAYAVCVEIAQAVDDEVDYSNFDANEDGIVDFIILIMEGWASGASNQFWSFKSILYPQYVSEIDSNAPTDGNGYLMLDNVIIKDFFVTTERIYNNLADVDQGDIHPIGTFCHELGHVLGLPDLYDTGEEKSAGIGDWGLMGSGNWQRQTSPAYMCAWSRSRMNWINPQLLSDLDNYPLTIEPAELPSSVPAYKLLIDTDNSGEYFLVENRQAIGSDLYLNETGLLIWHIDENFVDMYPARNSVNRIEATLGVNLMQADGEDNLYITEGQPLSNRGDNGDPFPGSKGNTSFTDQTYPNANSYEYDRNADGIIESAYSSGVSITNISEEGININATISCPKVTGFQISYDEGDYEGGYYQWGENRAGIVVFPDFSSYLKSVKTVFRPTSGSSELTSYTIRVWEGFNFNNGWPSNLIHSQTGVVDWSASDPERNFGWVTIYMDSTISCDVSQVYYIEIQFVGSGYLMPFDGGYFSNSLPSGLSYWRSAGNYPCVSFDYGDWNLRAIFGEYPPISKPTLMSPTDGTIDVATNPTLTWNIANGATSYRLQIATDSAFLSKVVDQRGIVQNSYSVTGLDYNTFYYWRVQGESHIGVSDWSEVWSFSTRELQPHFTFTENTDNYATVVIPVSANPNIDGNPLNSGDEIGAFTPQGLCVGGVVWAGKDTSITIWGDNKQTIEIDGINVGETMNFRIWNASNNIEYFANVSFSFGPSTYQVDGISVVDSLYATDVVPVELASFGAEIKDNVILLKWTTISESDNYGFSIERKIKSSEWKEIGFVPGYGTSNSEHNYTFMDRSPGKDISYYRIKQIDSDGQYMYYKPIQVEMTAPSAFRLFQNYPNPFNPTTVIPFDLPKKSNVRLILANILGGVVKEIAIGEFDRGHHEVELNAASLAAGLYFYKIEAGDFVDVKKLIVVK